MVTEETLAPVSVEPEKQPESQPEPKKESSEEKK